MHPSGLSSPACAFRPENTYPRQNMLARRTPRLLVAGAAILALAATACDTADATNRLEPPARGGTLNLISSTKIEHMDPQKIAAANDANLSRLYTRTLTTVRSEPGPGASEIVGDLATDTGRPSDGNRVWEFTLRKDVKWQDGAPVTCKDVKYGVERSFSDLFTTGLKYPKQLLADNARAYEGPFKGDNNNGKGLESVECVDQKTVRFRLKDAMGDFGYAVAMPEFAPVPFGKDTDKALYDRQPMASGPYRIAESDPAKKVVLERNQHWIAGTDSVRKQYPERIVITVDPNQAKVSYALVQDQGEAQSSVQLDIDVASNFVQQVINDPELSTRLIRGPHSGVRYLAINTRRITNVNCRKALAFAANKRKFRSAMGGSMFGELARSMISPSLRAHKEFDLYNALTKPEGDRDAARQLLTEAQQAGKPCPQKIRIAFPENRKRLVATVAESFQLVGIETELIGIDTAKNDYWGVAIGTPTNDYDVMWAGWIADWANGSAVIPPQFSGEVIPQGPDAKGNLNFSLLDDPEINALIKEARAEPNLEAQYRMWGNIDQKIMERAPVIPLMYLNSLRMVGSNVRGAFIHPAWGAPDAVALGLAKP